MKVMHEDDAREKTLVDNDEIRPEKAMKNTLIVLIHLHFMAHCTLPFPPLANPHSIIERSYSGNRVFEAIQRGRTRVRE